MPRLRCLLEEMPCLGPVGGEAANSTFTSSFPTSLPKNYLSVHWKCTFRRRHDIGQPVSGILIAAHCVHGSYPRAEYR